MFGKFKTKLQNLKVELQNDKLMEDYMLKLEVNLGDFSSCSPIPGLKKQAGQETDGARSPLFYVHRNSKVSASDVLEALDPLYFTQEFDAKGRALSDMTKHVSTIEKPAAKNPFKQAKEAEHDIDIDSKEDDTSANVGIGNPVGSTSQIDKASTGNPFSNENTATHDTSRSAGNPFKNNAQVSTQHGSAGNESTPGNPFLKVAHGPLSPPAPATLTSQVANPGSREAMDIYLMETISGCDKKKDVISKKLMKEVTANYDQFLIGLQHVKEVDLDLTRADLCVKSARHKLQFAKDTIVYEGLNFFRTKRKQNRIYRVRAAVRLIKQLSCIEDSIAEAAESGEFVDAQKLLKTAAEIVNGETASRFSSLDIMRERLDHTCTWLRRQMDEVLEETVLSFNQTTYKEIFRAYYHMDQDLNSLPMSRAVSGRAGEMTMDYGFIAKYRMKGPVESDKGLAGLAERVQRIFLNAIENKIRQCTDPNLSGPTSLGRMSSSISAMSRTSRSNSLTQSNIESDAEYSAACAGLSPNKVVGVLREFLKGLTEYLHSHFLCTQWHRDPFSELNSDLSYLHRPNRAEDELRWEASATSQTRTFGTLTSEEERVEVSLPSKFYTDSVALGYVHSRKVIWGAMQERIHVFMSSVNIKCPSFRLDHVCKISSLLTRINDVGHDFTGQADHNSTEDPPTLTNVLKRFMDDFERHAISTLDDFLARENWDRLHVSLDELGGMQAMVLRHTGDDLSKDMPAISSNEVVAQKALPKANIFEAFLQSGNPMEEEPSPKELKNLRVSEKGKDEPVSTYTPLKGEERVMTSTSVNGFAKFAGQCLQVMEAMPILQRPAFMVLFRILNYYMHSVINLFLPGTILADLLKGNLPNDDMNGVAWRFVHLRKTVCKIAEEVEEIMRRFSRTFPSRVIRSTSLSSEMSDENSLYGLEKCCVATESLYFLMEVLEFLRPRFEAILPVDFLMACSQMYEDSRLAINELRDLMYDVAARRVLSRELVLSMVEGLKWDKKDLPETYYPYVTKLLEKAGWASGQMQSLVPKHLHKSVWLCVVDVLVEHLLEAYSRVKKCTNNGRAQMALDLATLHRGLEQISSDSTECKRRNILGSYVRAYYFDKPEDYLSWMEAGLKEDGEFYSDSILARRHFLSLISLEKSPLSKLSRQKRTELKTNVETVWMKAIIARGEA